MNPDQGIIRRTAMEMAIRSALIGDGPDAIVDAAAKYEEYMVNGKKEN